MEIASIVIASLALASSIITPLIIAGASFINRIRKSDCCGGHVELDAQKTPTTNEIPNINNSELINQLQPTPSVLNKLTNLFKNNNVKQ